MPIYWTDLDLLNKPYGTLDEFKEKWSLDKPAKEWKCPNCGRVNESDKNDKCRVCGAWRK